MDHPHIAKVFDAGVTPEGRPYFVMELVKGQPITQYCDEHRLTPRQRLALFIPVCQAIQHAHQKGIIHRDIKPSNVLIAPYDDRPVPKVIDFGLAKATGVSLIEASQATNFGGVVGTPQYMSPEQASLNNLDIDTRSDIYSLGVLLYELLTGGPPFPQKELEKAGMLEMLRVIREDEPPRPSTKLSTADALPSISANRGTEPKKLTGLLRHELDWIVMKALEKDRTRRYETANGFAADINRYLVGEPVVAHPPSAAYRFKKFVRRNRAQAIAAGLMLLTLLAGIAGTSWGLYREAQRAEGERQAKQDAWAAKIRAEEREAETAAVLKFVEDQVFAAARPQNSGRDVKLMDAVTQSLPEVTGGFTNQPLIEARLRKTLGTSFWYLGKPEIAAEQFRRAADLHTAKLGPDHVDTLGSMMGLANAYSDLGRNAEALKLREDTLALQHTKLGPDHPDTLTTMNNIANSFHELGRRDEAVNLFEKVLALRKAKLGPDDPATLATMNNLAVAHDELGRHAEALKLHEQCFALRKAKLGADHPDTLWSMNNLAKSSYDLGRRVEAVRLFEDVLALRKTKLGPDHPATLGSMNNLAVGYNELGRQAESIKLHEEVLALRKAKLGADHPDTLWSMNNLAKSYYDLGRPAEAVKLFEEILALRRAKLGADHPATLTSMNNLAVGYGDLGRHAEALKLHEESLALRKAKLGPDHPDTLWSMNNLAKSFHDLGRQAEALKLFEEVLALRTAKLGPDHPDTLTSMNNVAWLYRALGRHAEAIKLTEETLALRKSKLGPDHPDTLWSMSNLAIAYTVAGRTQEAIQLNMETLELQKNKLGPSHPKTIQTIYNITCCHSLLTAKSDDRDKHADLAMDWLKQAVTAGYKDIAHMKNDKDLDSLRDRNDFKKLITDLEAKAQEK